MNSIAPKSELGYVSPDMQMAFVHTDATGQSWNLMSMLPGVVRPVSRGWVRLASADPLAKPLINPNYLACEGESAAADRCRPAGPADLRGHSVRRVV